MERLTKRLSNGDVIAWNPLEYYNYNDFKKVLERLAYYEDMEEEGRMMFDDEVILTLSKQSALHEEQRLELLKVIKKLSDKQEKIKKDLKYYLDTNEENGVVYIPKFVIEKIVKNT